MVIVKETKYSLCESIAMKIIKCGPIPRHLAFIMDGNRRYAKQSGLPYAIGHLHGYEKLGQTLGWCKDLGVKEITVFAFSIENFKRSPKEVNDLLSLANEKLSFILEEIEKIIKYDVCIRFFGKIDLLPIEISKKISQIVLLTAQNNKLYLNICMAYSSRHEMSYAMSKIAYGVKENLIKTSDINASLFESCLFTGRDGGPDMIIRSSEVRLSDFLLWQSYSSLLSFPELLWPSFTFYDLLKCIFYYQRNIESMKKIKEDLKINFVHNSDEVKTFLKTCHQIELDKLEKIKNTI